MSNYNTNLWLERARERAAMGGLIVEDKRCPKCGYNLRGLQLGGVCPECGRPITFAMRVPERRRTLADAPIPYIRLLQLGYAAMGVGGLLVGLVAVLDGLRLAAAAWAGLAAAGLWVGGLAIVALPRPARARHEAEDASWWALRIAALATQAVWLLLALWAAAAGGTAAANGVVAQGLALAGIVGFAPTFWLIKRMAEWAEDPYNGDRALNAGLYLSILLVLWVLGVRLVVPLALPYPIPVPIMVLLIAAAIGYALLQILREAQSASWTIAKIREDRARKSRDAEKRRAAWAAGERLRESEVFGGPVAPPPGSMFGLSGARRESGHGGQDSPARKRW